MNLNIYPEQLTGLSGYAFEPLSYSLDVNVRQKGVANEKLTIADISPVSTQDNNRVLLSTPRINGHVQLQSQLVKTFTVLTEQFQENSVQTNKWLTSLLAKFSTPAAKSERLPSPEELEIELSRALEGIKKTQQEISLGQMKQTRLHNQEKMKRNQEKMQEATNAAKAASKAGLAGKIFNWFSAAVMLVVGALLIGTGIAAGAGAFMVISGALSLTNIVMQHLGENGTISKENMKTIGWVLMALQVVVAVVGVIVTLGAAFPAVVAKISQSAVKALKVLTEMTTTMAQSAVRTFKLGTQATMTTLNVANGSAGVTHGVMQYRSLSYGGEVKMFQADLNQMQKFMDAMQQGFKQNMAAWLQAMSLITQMLHAKGQTSDRILCRPATV